MADWRKLAVDLVLADNVIDETEVKILKKHLYEDGKIDKKEVEFLVELRNLGQKRLKGQALSPAFEKFFFKAVEDFVLADGVISNAEAKWLDTVLWADGKIDDGEKKFLAALKKKATNDNKNFNALYEKCMAK
jgi:uncharacterized tellurite resistance protein B-like protein